jgi:anionic cell wall polymer biosynthesis LytR-Cps2A-Psr (LCP) family protein
MSRPRSRARRSRYSYTSRLSSSLPAAFLVVFLVGVLFGASFVVVRAFNFVHTVTGSNPTDVVKIVQNAVQPPAGSVAYKLLHNEQVNILVLGVGGAENDAPELSDTIMIVTLDPQSHHIIETSIPRDTWVQLDAWTDGRDYSNKINVANEIGADDTNSLFPCCKKPQYTGRDGGGHLAEDTVTRLTGIHFDRYVRVDFKAFRDTVDALGGVDIHLDSPLDDCHYPDYHNGYINHGVPPGYPCPPGSGIHFAAGDLHVTGEQALEISRSRDASEPDQATDFARAKRQQLIVQAIRKKAMSANAINNLPQLMDAVQKNVKTDLDVNDIRTVYDWGSKVPDSSFVKVALTNADLLQEYYGEADSCGDPSAYVLCALDPTYKYLQFYLSRVLIDPKTLREHVPVQFVNATAGSADIDTRVTNSLRPFGLQLVDPPELRMRAAATTTVYDYTGGADPLTVAWLEDYFGATVVTVTPSSPGTAGTSTPLVRGADTTGVVVVLGHDFATRFYGLGG